MDTTEKYIKMCTCEEIQDYKRGPENGDYFELVSGFYGSGDCGIDLNLGVHVYTDILELQAGFYDPLITIWLPQQDQLQDIYCSVMVDGKHNKEATTYLSCFNVLCEEIAEFSKDDCNMELKSMEQIWLAFVMKELYNKTWNGEQWNSNNK